MNERTAWHHAGAWAKIMAACVLDSPYMMSPEFLPDADCENCEHKQYAQGGHCYVFLERPGDKCGQFKAREQKT
jgi:hypothetical protein